nr:hypothetical protein L204_02252 [Cryptococcus depauperatus CBS 7855]
MSARRRPSSTSTATARSFRENSAFKIFRSPSVGNATSKMDEDEDDMPRRNTRHRNPLPPTTGPLFPPLPPKHLKNKDSSVESIHSPVAQHPSESKLDEDNGSPGGNQKEPSELDVALDQPTATTLLVSATKENSTRNNTRLPSGSNAFLTPPPPTSEDANTDVDSKMSGHGVEDMPEHGIDESKEPDGLQGKGEEEEDWESYRKQRAVRGFGQKDHDVKQERDAKPEANAPEMNGYSGEEEDQLNTEEFEVVEGFTPTQTHHGKVIPRAISIVSASAGNTPASTGSASEPSRSVSRQGRRRRGEEQLLLDDHLLPVEIRRTAQKEQKTDVEEEGKVEQEDGEDEQEGELEDDDDGEGEDSNDVTRCVCKREDIDVMMIQCDHCNVWQHGECMGIWGDEEAPDEYFCEECKPERHQALKKWLRSRGRNAGPFVPPTPEKLEQLHSTRDINPPTQSKRWSDFSAVDLPQPNPPARSHHKKEKEPLPNSVEPTDNRWTRGRQSSTREKPPSSGGLSRKGSGKRSKKSENDNGSEDESSPAPSSYHTKKRSTMNSRDSAYEEAVKAAVEASKKEAVDNEDEVDESQEDGKDEGRGGKRRRTDQEEEDKEKLKKGKRRKEEQSAEIETSQIGPSSSKPKHPNQYTYRPKPPSVTGFPASPSRRPAGATPIPVVPLHHDHGTRRAGALANAPTVFHPLSEESANQLSWCLPDYLQHFADILPGLTPSALEVPVNRELSHLHKNFFFAQRYGPFPEDRDENGKLVLPEEQGGREILGYQTTQLEPPTRIRYPPKRVSGSDMRKRVRAVLEYVGKMQVDEGKRLKRAKVVGIKATPAHIIKQRETERKEREMREIAQQEEANGHHDSPMAEHEPCTELDVPMLEPTQPRSFQLMAELTKRLIAFQEAFSNNGFTTFENGHSGSVPPTPTIPNASSVPVTPSFPSFSAADKFRSHPPPRLAESLVAQASESVGTSDSTNGDVNEMTTTKDIGIGRGVEVYRADIVNKVVTMSDTEREVAQKVEQIIQG